MAHVLQIATNHDPWRYLWLVFTLFLISNFLISVFIYSVRWILTCNSLNKTNTTKLFLLKNVFKKLQEICPKKHIFEQSIIFAWHPTTRNNCGHWIMGNGKMGIFNSAAAFLAHKEAGSVVKDKISELLPLS